MPYKMNPFTNEKDYYVREDLSRYLTLDQTTPQKITGDTPKLDVLKSKSILGTDADGKIIEGTHQDISGLVPYTGANANVDLGSFDLTTTGTLGAGISTLTSVKTATIFPPADSTTAVQINKADGTTNVLNVDTTNGNVGIGTTSPSQKLDVDGNINIDEASAYLFDGVNGLKLAKNGEANYYSTLVGAGAGNSGSALSTYQTALGYNAGYSNTGDRQTAVGYYAGRSNEGAYQTALGYYAGRENTGASQTALGYYAGYSNTGTKQTALGYWAGRENTGNQVTGIGYEATYLNTADDVVAIGYQAGKR